MSKEQYVTLFREFPDHVVGNEIPIDFRNFDDINRVVLEELEKSNKSN
ncbi:MAG: hypothetical protein ACW99A_23775 [Candidatus Kariarchaeaceae archaeon]